MPTIPAKTVLFLNGLGFGRGEAPVVERILARMPGVTRAYVNALTETAYVEHDPDVCPVEWLVSRLREANFGAKRLGDSPHAH